LHQGNGHEGVETGIDVEIPATRAVAADRRFKVGLTVRRADAFVAVARDVQVLAAIAAAAIILRRSDHPRPATSGACGSCGAFAAPFAQHPYTKVL